MKNLKQQIKNGVIITAFLVALYLIYIFAIYWDVIVEAFKAGWDSI